MFQKYLIDGPRIFLEMPKLRKRSHGLPLIKPYMKKNDRNVRRWRYKQKSPIEITKSNLKRIIDEIKEEDNSKPKHKLIEQYGSGAESALSMCVAPSLELLTFNPSSLSVQSVPILLDQLRKSLLNHDWNFSSHLLQILIHSKLINKRLLIYVIRTSLIILLNNCEHPEILEEFLTLTLGLSDETKIEEFLSSIFAFPEEMKTQYLVRVKSRK